MPVAAPCVANAARLRTLDAQLLNCLERPGPDKARNCLGMWKGSRQSDPGSWMLECMLYRCAVMRASRAPAQGAVNKPKH
eukprot:3741692-Prymnesium_polylepis.1